MGQNGRENQNGGLPVGLGFWSMDLFVCLVMIDMDTEFGKSMFMFE